MYVSSAKNQWEKILIKAQRFHVLQLQRMVLAGWLAASEQRERELCNETRQEIKSVDCAERLFPYSGEKVVIMNIDWDLNGRSVSWLLCRVAADADGLLWPDDQRYSVRLLIGLLVQLVSARRWISCLTWRCE